MRKTIIALCLGLLPLVIGGCTFARLTANDWVRELDASGIQVGVSTWRDVLDQLGPPAPSAQDRVSNEVPKLDYFRYVCSEVKTVECSLFQVGVLLPLSWSDEYPVDVLLVEFDDKGVVSCLSRRKGHAVWRPLQDESDRRPAATEFFAEEVR